MSLPAFVMALEQIFEFIVDVTVGGGVALNLLRETKHKLTFEGIRRHRCVRIQARLGSGEINTCLIKGESYVEVEDLGGLRDGICACLVPSLRAINVLRGLLNLQVEFCQEKGAASKMFVALPPVGPQSAFGSMQRIICASMAAVKRRYSPFAFLRAWKLLVNSTFSRTLLQRRGGVRSSVEQP